MFPTTLIIGVLLCESGEAESAISSLRSAIRLSPNHPQAWRNLGIVLARSGRLNEAKHAYRQAIELMPGAREIWEDLMAVCNESNDLPGLLAARREMVRRWPDDPSLHSSLLYLLHYSEDIALEAMFAEHLAFTFLKRNCVLCNRWAVGLRWGTFASCDGPAARGRAGPAVFASDGFEM